MNAFLVLLRRRRLLLAGLLLCCLDAAASAQTRFGPQSEPQGELRQQDWRIPLPNQSDVAMFATVFRPPGDGKHPLAVINHGTGSPEERAAQRSIWRAASTFLARGGYVVVLPLRRGYGATGGPWGEDYGRCDSPDYKRAGLEASKDIEAAIVFMTKQDFVKPDPALVMGVSAGGWSSLALASRNTDNVALVVNFAGGRGGNIGGKANNNCRGDKLVEAAGEYGKTSRKPTLWIYAKNDLYFGPNLVKQMLERFRAGGGRADFEAMPPHGKDGHMLFGQGVEIWKPVVEKWLTANGG